MEKSDGYELGKKFIDELSRAATEEGAVEQWFNNCPALCEFEMRYPFFRGLMTSIGKELKHRATWKKVFLSMGAAAFSMFDIITDIFSIMLYKSKNLDDVANMMIFFVLLSLGLQLGVVIGVHHKSKRRLLVEIVGTLTFTKPAFNKYRVLTNAKIEGHEIVPPLAEMMTFKICEVFAESIPLTVLQVNTILMSEKPEPLLLLGLLSSAAFVSEGITYLAYMKDISERSRRTGKLFYGFIPLSGRRLILVKLSMYLLSFSQLLGKSLEVAVLIQIRGKAMAISVIGCEIGVYLLYKSLRRGEQTPVEAMRCEARRSAISL